MNYKPYFFNISSMILMLIISGCMLGPDFKKPEYVTDIPTTRENVQAALTDTELAEWWNAFNDPLLTQLIEHGLAENLTVKQAVSRVRQSRLSLRQTTSALLPSISASVRETNERKWEPDTSSEGASIGLDASWEIDFFGGNRRNREASYADLEASGYSLEDAKVSLAAEIATEYIELRLLQANYDTTLSNIEIQVKSARIARAKFDSGFGRGLDTISSETQIETTKALIPAAEAEIKAAIRRIEILLSVIPGTFDELLLNHSRIPSNVFIAKSGIPSDLLKRRPDVRKAEALLHAATARIGVAEADRFPKFTIGGAATISVNSLSDWSNAIKTLSTGPTLSIPIFSGGSKKARVAQYLAAAEEAELAYKETVLAALSEVDTAWHNLDLESKQREFLLKAVDGERKTLKAAELLYENGETDLQDVLSYQRALLSAEQSLNTHRASLAKCLIKLYKSFGGGIPVY